MYSVTGLRELRDSKSGSARPGGINNSGQVVGWASVPHTHNPEDFVDNGFLWSGGETFTLGAEFRREVSQAHAINDSGQVVGWSGDPDDRHAVLWNADESGIAAKALGMFPSVGDDQNAEAHAINNRGVVVGGVATPEFGHVFLWNELTGMEDLGTLPGTQFGEAHAITDDENIHVVGSCATSAGDRHAFIWSRVPTSRKLDRMRRLRMPHDREFSEAHGINNHREVVGWASTPGDRHAFFWAADDDRAFGDQDLGTLPDHQFSEAHAISSSGARGHEVVGGSFSSDSSEPEERRRRAFIFIQHSGTTEMQDLNNLIPPNSGWELLEAYDINDSGQILCEGFHTGPDNAKQRHLCVLTLS